MKRVLTIIVVLAVVGAGAYYLIWGRTGAGADSASLTTVTVGKDTIVSEVAATGSVEPEREVSLSFKAPGRVAAVLVKAGDRVVTGQPLATQDTADMDLQLQQAQAALRLTLAQAEKLASPPADEDLAAARAALQSARAGYDRAASGPKAEQVTIAQVQLQKAEIALQRAQTAYDEVKWVGAIGALPQSLALQAATLDYEAAKANYDLQVKPAEASDLAALSAQIVQAQSQVARLERGLSDEDRAIAMAQIDQARIAVEQIELQRVNATLTAPFTGRVAAVYVEEGQIAGGGGPVVTLVEDGRYHISVRVDETDVGQVAEGQRVDIQPESFPGLALAGHVAQVSLSPATAEGGGLLGGTAIVQYDVRVDVDVDEDFEGLRPGMTAQVIIEAARYEDAVVVPNRAVQVDRESGVTFVEKLVSGEPVRQEIALGVAGEGVTQVVFGLDEGDSVVIRSVSSLDELRNTFMPMGN